MEETIIVFGSGERAENTITMLRKFNNVKIIEIWDNAPQKWGTIFYDISVVKPHKMREKYNKIIIASVYFDEIYTQLIQQYKIDKEKIVDYKYPLKFIERHIEEKYIKSESREIQDILRHMRKNGIMTFNYDFPQKYENMKYDIQYDEKKEMYYAIWSQKKMYFSKKFSNRSKVSDYLRGICIEQDIESPHRYCTDNYSIKDGMTIIDAGVAEGFFTLDNIDIIHKAYLVEADPYWVEALEETFREYSEKVIIINKFLGNVNDENSITIDYIAKNEKIDFIKMDIEGAEKEALRGAVNILENGQKLGMVACAYHQKDDAKNMEYILRSFFDELEFSKGYMFFQWDQEAEFDFRKGVIRARRQ